MLPPNSENSSIRMELEKQIAKQDYFSKIKIITKEGLDEQCISNPGMSFLKDIDIEDDEFFVVFDTAYLIGVDTANGVYYVADIYNTSRKFENLYDAYSHLFEEFIYTELIQTEM